MHENRVDFEVSGFRVLGTGFKGRKLGSCDLTAEAMGVCGGDAIRPASTFVSSGPMKGIRPTELWGPATMVHGGPEWAAKPMFNNRAPE